jgi:phosphoglycolate phosphatase-like HAD superfamily hydrolase
MSREYENESEFKRSIDQLAMRALNNPRYKPKINGIIEVGNLKIGAPNYPEVLPMAGTLIDIDVDGTLAPRLDCLEFIKNPLKGLRIQNDLSANYKAELAVENPQGFGKIYQENDDNCLVIKLENRIMDFAGRLELEKQEAAVQKLADAYHDAKVTKKQIDDVAKRAARKTRVAPGALDAIRDFHRMGITVGTLTSGIRDPAVYFAHWNLGIPAIMAEGAYFEYDKNSIVFKLNDTAGINKKIARIRKTRELGFSPRWTVYVGDIKFMSDREIAEVHPEDPMFMNDPYLGGGLLIGLRSGTKEIAREYARRGIAWIGEIAKKTPFSAKYKKLIEDLNLEVFGFDELPDKDALAVCSTLISGNFRNVVKIVMAKVFANLTTDYADGSTIAGNIDESLMLKEIYDRYKNAKGDNFFDGLKQFLYQATLVYNLYKPYFPRIDMNDKLEELRKVSVYPNEIETQKKLMVDILDMSEEHLWILSHERERFSSVNGFDDYLTEYRDLKKRAFENVG